MEIIYSVFVKLSVLLYIKRLVLVGRIMLGGGNFFESIFCELFNNGMFYFIGFLISLFFLIFVIFCYDMNFNN